MNNNSGQKLKNAAKPIAGIIGVIGLISFIIGIVSYGISTRNSSVGEGETVTAILLLVFALGIYIFAAWLAYHILNAIGEAAVNSQILVELAQQNASPKKNAEEINQPITPILRDGDSPDTIYCLACGKNYRKRQEPGCPYCGSLDNDPY